jgi:hypothetical protein
MPSMSIGALPWCLTSSDEQDKQSKATLERRQIGILGEITD